MSKLQGLVVHSGFNGSTGYNGSQGPQRPRGTGHFSQCEHNIEDLNGNQVPITSNILPSLIRVINGKSNVVTPKEKFNTIPFVLLLITGTVRTSVRLFVLP